MKRFIRYLYEYEEGRRMRNVGFVKVDQGDDECVVHIHGKGLHLSGEQELSVYLFYEDGTECVGMLQGVVDHVNPAVNYQLRFTPEDTGVRENYPRIDGIIMENQSRRKYAAVWDDMPVNVDAMRLWKPTEKEAAAEPEMTETEAAEPGTAEPGLGQMAAEAYKETCEADDKQQGKRCSKIRRQDIAMLPRCEWKLANNSFLLHGCYNYHHLLLIEEDGNSWLGVPGLYHPKEAKAAEAFGFPQFVKREEAGVALEEEEAEENDKFGYWCRHVKR